MQITIQTNADFTPAGKRTVRVVRHAKSGKKCAPVIRWYVGGKIYATHPLNGEGTALSLAWLVA